MPKDMGFKQFSDYLSKIAPNIQGQLEKTISLCCQKVRSDIQGSMAKTPRDMTKTYFTNNKTKGHHPSLPGNPPAPDTGNLRNSIRYEVYGKGKEVYGIVGSTQKEPDYAVYTEYGTTKMKPRPWLRPAMLKNNDWIRKAIAKVVGDSIKGAAE
jgi:HK97 gp10 family phage protein